MVRDQRNNKRNTFKSGIIKNLHLTDDIKIRMHILKG